MRKQVIATIYSNAIHNEQILCAARVWAEKNDYSFTIRCEKMPDPYYATAVQIIHKGRTILFDMSDSPALLNVTSPIDVYYKRSFIKESIKSGLPYPVLPLGFNYGVTYKPFSWQRAIAFQLDKVYIARSMPLLNCFTNLSYNHIDYRKMHDGPRDNGGNILFLTRLWDPAKTSSNKKKSFRQHLNAVRIDTVKQLKKKFSQRLTAGIEDSPLARNLCPDLIVDRKISSKKNYLDLLKGSDICIATNGLENTLGWRIAEYVAFSKAVVTEPFDITVPGWKKAEHYHVFNDDLEEQIDDLLYQKRYVAMQQQNHEYYKRYMEPEALFNRLISTSTGI